MRKWNVIVSDIVEKVDVVLWKQERCGDRVNGSITPTFVKETTILIQGLEKVEVSL